MVNHQLAGWSAGVDPLATHAEHDQTDATTVQVIHDPQQVRGASCQPVRLAGHQRVATADEAQGFLQSIALGHG
jgi:hypothetical protein